MATPQEIQQAKSLAQSSAQKLSQATSEGYNIEGELKNKLNEAYNYNQDIVKPLDQATSTYLTAPQVAREKYQDIFNPFSREKLVSQYTQGESLPMLSLANVLGTRRGNIGDAITAGSQAHQGYVSGLQGEAALQRQSYQDLVTEYQQDLQNRLSERQMALQERKANETGDPIEALLSRIKAFESAGGASPTQEQEALKAQSVLTDISLLKGANPNSLKKAALLASSTGTGGILSGATGLYARATATPEEQDMARALTNIKNNLRLTYTGAAFSQSEPDIYNLLIGDSISAYKDPQSVINAINRLEPYFGQVAKQGQNPYQSYIDQYKGGLDELLGGQSMQSQEIPVRRISDGMTGYVSANEFNPSIYERL